MKLHGGGADRPLTCWENELELAGGPQEGKCYQISPATQNSFFKQKTRQFALKVKKMLPKKANLHN